jgi:putative transposase
VAADQKKVVRLQASLIFTDESGFLMLPLVRRTLAVQGHTPVLSHRARHRDKVSVAAALTLSPARGHANLYYQTYPGRYVNAAVYAQFLRRVVLRHVPARRAVVLVHDQGNMHKGPCLRALCGDCPRLDLNPLPPYAPELNPVEYLWNFEKDKALSNFVPQDVRQLNAAVDDHLRAVRHDQSRLRSFFASTPLPWDGLTVFF